MRRVAMLTAAAGLLGACSEAQLALHATKSVEQAFDDSSTTHGAYKVGNPYAVEGVWYTPREDFAYDETGIASWYGPGFHAKRTANGDVFDQNALTAAHPTLQMPAKVQVTNLENGRSIALVVNDRGPYKRGRILDVSRRAAQLLGFDANGTARVRVKVLTDESLQMAALAGRKGASTTMVAKNSPRVVPPVPAVPREAVAVASLDPVPIPAAPPSSVPPAAPPLSPTPAAAPVTLAPVGPTSLFVQAGAFTQRANAERLRVRLTPIGPTQISEFQQGNQHFYRVRVGPLRSVDEADAALGRVVGQGQSDARVVVD
jgi:rare lipoprotein A